MAALLTYHSNGLNATSMSSGPIERSATKAKLLVSRYLKTTRRNDTLGSRDYHKKMFILNLKKIESLSPLVKQLNLRRRSDCESSPPGQTDSAKQYANGGEEPKTPIEKKNLRRTQAQPGDSSSPLAKAAASAQAQQCLHNKAK
ncbi:hypothetical protein E1301_Tti004847 [Triplophysa tibetana]|uniref:Uncharacterized protein n=1 Tax=Triplophysa tibetana TaxID=1572043 RepID=A0A5A9NSJ8_9TELE|nr:hypothetical protein E1301_Tti004847 [Triplophysa tibetana]